MIDRSLDILRNLRRQNGLFCAANASKTGYNRAWIRDNVYEALGFEAVEDYDTVRQTFRALLDLLRKHEYKIDWAIREKPLHAYQYIHARYDADSMDEIWDNWGNKQNDAVGALLFKICQLEKAGAGIIRDSADRLIIQKLVWYLESIEYWHDPDNGMWENDEEVHASSIGACVAGLRAAQGIANVPDQLIENGVDALSRMLPRESASREVDLAQLSLIYPYDVLSKEQKLLVLQNVEEQLVRERGCIRYAGDWYYQNEKGEAQWCFGFAWLAIIYRLMGDQDRYAHYITKAKDVMTHDGYVPELYFAGSAVHNENTPLGWAQAMLLLALKI